jgi:uridine kinase
VHVSADDFHHVRAVRHQRGRDSPEGFWLDSYDYPALIENVLAPFGPGGGRRYRAASHDLHSDEVLDLPWQQAPAGAVLVLDGLFLLRDELAGHWDLSIFLTAPFEVTVARMAARDGSHPDPEHPSVARYVQGQRLYFAACRPWERADLVIDNSDVDRPALVTRTDQGLRGR